MNRLTNDTKVCADALTKVLPDLCEMSARLFSAVIVLIVMQPKFAYVILPGGALLMIVTVLFRSRLKELHSLIQKKDGDLGSSIRNG